MTELDQAKSDQQDIFHELTVAKGRLARAEAALVRCDAEWERQLDARIDAIGKMQDARRLVKVCFAANLTTLAALLFVVL